MNVFVLAGASLCFVTAIVVFVAGLILTGYAAVGIGGLLLALAESELFAIQRRFSKT